MPDRPGTDMSHEHEWRHGAEWKQQARDPDYRPITEESDMTSADGHGVYLTHEEYTALLAERGRPEAERDFQTEQRLRLAIERVEKENQKLRDVLDEVQNAPEPDHHCPAFRHVMDIVGTALAEQKEEYKC